MGGRLFTPFLFASCSLQQAEDKILTLFPLLSSADKFANSLDPDQARQNVGPDLDPNCLTL